MEYRLKRQRDFNEVFAKGKRAYTKYISVICIEKPKDNLKIGISVSKKHGNAVTRNKIKRLIRAAYRDYLLQLGKFHIVLLPKVGAEYSFSGFAESLEFCFKKLNLLKDEKTTDRSN